MSIQKEISIYKKPVMLDDGEKFDLPRTLKKTDRYIASRFMSSSYDKDGFKKIFYNISKRPLKASQKAVDIDTKNILIKARDGQSYIPAWFFNLELKQFMKDEGFDKLLNQITERYPKYGEVVVKDVAGVPEIKILKNLRWEPSVHINDSPWVHEDHPMSLGEFIDEANDKGWDNVDEVKKKMEDQTEKNILLVERTGYFKKSEIDSKANDKDKMVYGMVLKTAGNEDEKRNDNYANLPELTITTKILKENPYRSVSWEEVDGRGLGVGVVEEIFELQEFYNDVNNKERKALEWNSKKLFKSGDPTKNKNLFLAKRNGDVIDDKDLAEIPIQERNLGSYLNLYKRIEDTTSGITFTHEINTGESLPSGTPFRLGAVMSGAVDSYYGFKREKLGIFLQDIIEDFVIPSFKKSKRKSHILNFDSDSEDIKKLDEMLVNELMRKAIEKFEKKHGKLPSMVAYERQRARVQELIVRKKTRFLELPDRFYDNANIYADVIITGEQENTDADLTSLSNLYQILAEKGDPRAEDVLDKAMNKSGNNPVSFKRSEAPAPSPTGATQLADLIPKK